MRSVPTAEEKRFYEENGFVPIDPFLSSEELDEWRRVVDEAVMSAWRSTVFHPGRRRPGQRRQAGVDRGPGVLPAGVPAARQPLANGCRFSKAAFSEGTGAVRGRDGRRGGPEGMARPGSDKAALRQPDGLPSRRTVLVSSLPPTPLRSGSPSTTPPSRTGACTTYPGATRRRSLTTSILVRRSGLFSTCTPRMARCGSRPVPGPHRRSITAQWAYVPWRWRKYDTRVAPGHHLRLYARRVHLQRTTKCLAARVLEELVYRGPARLRRTEPACFPARSTALVVGPWGEAEGSRSRVPSMSCSVGPLW